MSGGGTTQFGGRNWLVLDERDGHALLLHETVITDQPYHHTHENVTWATSSSRVWLNGELYNSFSAADKARIRETAVITNDNPWWRTNGGNNTTDRIFLLSIDEAVRYFGDSGMLARGAKNKSVRRNPEWPNHGIYYGAFHDQFSNARIAYNSEGAASDWWLRSPGHDPKLAAIVKDVGMLYVYGDMMIFSKSRVGLRPALWLNLES